MPYIPLESEFPHVNLGMWYTEEEERYFLDRLNIYENEQERLAAISHPGKRLEWLSSRLCLKRLLDINHKVESLNHATGKPYLSDQSYFISYSHSNRYAAAIASSQGPVSIDLEDLNKDRNFETSRLFMNPEEKARFEESGDSRHFFLTWSGKETLFKIADRSGVIFREHLTINPEGKTLEQKGAIKGIIQDNESQKTYIIHYHFFPDVLLTYTHHAE